MAFSYLIFLSSFGQPARMHPWVAAVAWPPECLRLALGPMVEAAWWQCDGDDDDVVARIGLLVAKNLSLSASLTTGYQ